MTNSATIERTFKILYSVVSTGTCPLPLHSSWAPTDHNTIIDQMGPAVSSSTWIESPITMQQSVKLRN